MKIPLRFCLFVIIPAAVTVYSFLALKPETEPSAAEKPGPETAENTAPETQTFRPLSSTLTFVAAGDNLFHQPMLRPPKAGETYDFTPFYAGVKDLIESADVAFVNQETLLAGKDFGFSSYPRFNTPQEAGDALIQTGFTVINHANNHIMDKGEAAVFATMDFWDSHPEATYLGIRRSQEARDTPTIIEKNSIRLGFLAYTYDTNGLGPPKDKPYLVSLIDQEVMTKEIQRIRPRCDFLIVSMHWGNEYYHRPSEGQKKLAGFLAEQGVDLIIGHHPHVLQPAASFPRKNGGPPALCFYSLGNFISAQDMNKTLLGGLLYLKLKKENSQVSVEETGVIPVVTHYEGGFTNIQVFPLYAYPKELAEKHRNAGKNNFSIENLRALAGELLGPQLMNYNPFVQP
ncbi:MAG: CapA family protein [Spirochaetaceae bacterium]|nr:CapA family protein [Spirochaetaceae bacterium]